MILRLLIFALVAGVVYRFFGGKIPFIDKKPVSKAEHEFGEIEPTSQCAQCGTYMTEDDALIYHRQAYCSTECVEKAKRLK